MILGERDYEIRPLSIHNDRCWFHFDIDRIFADLPFFFALSFLIDFFFI